MKMFMEELGGCLFLGLWGSVLLQVMDSFCDLAGRIG